MSASSTPAPPQFLSDLEFLLSLSSPPYLHHLSLTNPSPFDSLNFQFYLRHLQTTFARPEMAVHVKYPLCLEHLRLLINPDVALLSSKAALKKESSLPDVYGVATPFALRLRDERFRDEIHAQSFNAWRWRVKRIYGGGENDWDRDNKEEEEVEASEKGGLDDDDDDEESVMTEAGSAAA